MTANGTRVPKNSRRAGDLYLEAACKLDAAAQNNLGEMYETVLALLRTSASRQLGTERPRKRISAPHSSISGNSMRSASA